uniref:Integrase p46 n=1 Tax=Moloney murine leukemia virus (isolate Shinnick) TaxID=928306 RepID=UPI0003E9D153|nr:Chain A, Integrase p46 [Moloney murine leukemia virus isolate Shinnick]4NZG_B Chain B, Integrase p46 [Moloney murine leukemia virus isolate Shinnick]4NZG_C Chain C, Integrase p46 [Moloney murine leukemia virus isolate Shinnick]4NZG_D Chain D, Integrase p46 [Moloney murine leukemia virus isolate Shinnick]
SHTSEHFHYTVTDIKDLTKLGAIYDKTKKYWVYQGKPVMPDQFTFELLDFLHQLTHLSFSKMKALLERSHSPYYMLNRDRTLKNITETCKACAQVNASKS